jgi:hypothetical protein
MFNIEMRGKPAFKLAVPCMLSLDFGKANYRKHILRQQKKERKNRDNRHTNQKRVKRQAALTSIPKTEVLVGRGSKCSRQHTETILVLEVVVSQAPSEEIIITQYTA